MKLILKIIIDLIAKAVVLPAAAICWLSIAVCGADKAFPGWSQLFSLVPGLTGVYLRRAFYKLVLPRCGDGACLTFGSLLSHPSATIGRNVYVGAYCSIGAVDVGDDVLIASHVSVMNGAGQHGIGRLDVPIREQPGVFQRVSIGRDSWIGERATICANIGQHCVIGAGAVVTKPIPDYAIAVGVPAQVVRFRNEPQTPEERVAQAEQLIEHF